MNVAPISFIHVPRLTSVILQIYTPFTCLVPSPRDALWEYLQNVSGNVKLISPVLLEGNDRFNNRYLNTSVSDGSLAAVPLVSAGPPQVPAHLGQL